MDAKRVVSVGAGVALLTWLVSHANAGVFRPRVDYHVAGDPWAATIVDPNHDGSPDIMVTQHRTAFFTIDSKIMVMANDHEGGLTPTSSLPAIEYGGYLTSADFNVDGRLDVAVVTTSDSVQIMLNNADGTWSTTRFREPGDLIFVRARDLTGDGFPDLVAANRSSHRVQVFANDGAGGFSLWRNLNVVGSPTGLAILHINSDGIPDIAVSVVTTTMSILVSRGLGDYERRTSPMPGFQSHVEAADLDHDGDDDLIMGQGSSILMLRNNGDETFGPPVATQVPSGVTRHAMLDFDQDGWVDVAAASAGSEVITLLRNVGGNLVRGEDLPSGVIYNGPQVADLDGNGYPDLIGCRVEDDTVSVWMNANGPTTAVLLEAVDYTIVDEGIRLIWTLGGGCPSSVGTVERRDHVLGTWEPRGSISAIGSRVEYVDHAAVAGEPYAYRLVTERCGILGEVWIDWGIGSLNLRAEIRPNPAIGRFNLVFDLPLSAAANLELWDVQGRRVETRDLGDLGPGRHSIALGEGARLAPGVYLVRLIQGSRVFTTRACLVE